MKRPTQTAQRVALFALLASRDTIDLAKLPVAPNVLAEISRDTAARALLGAIGLTATPENLKEARVEVTRACILVGVGI